MKTVTFCASEAYPFVKTGGLADVCGALPMAIKDLGYHVNLVIPAYKKIFLEHEPHKFDLNKVDAELYHLRYADVDVYFIEHQHFFYRDGLYGDENGDYSDNLMRYQFFCEETLKMLKRLDISSDIIHCHDWQSALIPMYLKTIWRDDPFFQKTKTFLTIHNLAFQGVFPRDQFHELKLPREYDEPSHMEFYGKINWLKGAIRDADKVSTVSPSYALEIVTEEYGCGLEGTLGERDDGIVGITNGIDRQLWDPQEDHFLSIQYGMSDVKEGKALNKRDLLAYYQVSAKDNPPVFGYVSRVSHQKGTDLIIEGIDELAAKGAVVLILGQGDPDMVSRLEELTRRLPRNLVFCNTFNEQMAHEIYAGSDFLLMPSRFEPCGISQMISMRYGTLPIVRLTGGLKDTVTGYEQNPEKANGFCFEEARSSAFVQVCHQALDVYHDPQKMSLLRENAMEACFDWETAARQYAILYESVLCESHRV